MYYIKCFFLMVCFLLSNLVVFSQANPLFSDNEVIDTLENQDTVVYETKVYEVEKDSSVNISIFNTLIKKNAALQQSIKDRFALLANDYTDSGSIRVLLLIFFFSFLYGIFHSLGPGHGKVFIFSYILTEQPKVLKAISTSYLIAAVHAISGLVVALIIIFSLSTYSSASGSIANTSVFISRISFGIIVALGLYLLIKAIRNKNDNHSHQHEHTTKRGQLWSFIFSVGLVPCPGTIITVTFLASMGLFYVGISSVLFIILGMGITISLIGLISMFSKKLVLKLYSIESKNYEKVYNIVSIFGASMLVILGVMFLLGTF